MLQQNFMYFLANNLDLISPYLCCYSDVKMHKNWRFFVSKNADSEAEFITKIGTKYKVPDIANCNLH